MTRTNKRQGIKPWRLVKSQPTASGHYWYRLDDQHELSIVEVFYDKAAHDWCVRMGYGLTREVNFLANYVGEWAGPIPRPRNEDEITKIFRDGQQGAARELKTLVRMMNAPKHKAPQTIYK